jgi:DNA-binding CsgD family transcriptional regulator
MDDPAPGPGQRAGLRGRASECALLDGLIADIRQGGSRTLVLRGQAGIGKTALLDYLVESALDVRVLRAVGVESEMELAYSGLQQVCAPLFDRLENLPEPQRQALEVVFGLDSGAVPDRFLVGLGVLSLLSAAADQHPLLCVVDDAQWLDQASAQTLAFAARRLAADSVGVVFGARESGEALGQLPELEVQGLVNGDARALLGSAMRFMIDERVRDRIIAETHGNPLALLELPRGLTATQLAGGFGLVGIEGLPGRIEESFMRRLTALPDDAQRLLLVAAAEPVGDPLLLLRAAEQLGITVSAVDTTAQTDGLLSLRDRVTFRHPLARSAVYRSAPVTERQAVHLALAEATDRDIDPDRRAWHLGAAAAAPDEQVALELERSASRAQARGGVAASAAFLQRAVALTDDPARRPDRALAAAQATLQAGAFDAALGLLATAEAGAVDEVQRAQAELLRGHVALASGSLSDAPGLLLEAAQLFEPLDMQVARETYVTAWGAAFTAVHLTGGEDGLEEICRAIRALPPPPGDPRPLDLLLDGLALLTVEGHAAAAETLKRASTVLTTISLEEVLRWGWVATGAPTAVWDDECFRLISERQVQLVRDAGALAQLPIHLAQLVIARAWIGDFDGAASLIAESDSAAAATGSRFPPHALLRLRSLEGKEADATAAIASAIDEANAGRQGVPSHAHLAAAVLYNGLGRYDKAASAAGHASANTLEPWYSMWALPELVEAAVRVGDDGVARDALERLAQTTQPSGTDFALGVEARCRALLSHGTAADDLYREAMDRLGRTRLRPELARAHLLYGEWLRRENRRLDAREQLRAAYRELTSIGMDAFAERARLELLATGEKVRRRRVEAVDELTAQERQIARLARDGLSNSNIAARLFLSPRTIEWHLHNVFSKLRIRSRRELMSAMSASEPGSRHPTRV